MPVELIVPRKKIYFNPLEEGIFIPISDDVPDLWRTPHVRKTSGKITGYASGWRSGLSYEGGQLYKFKGCRPTGRIIDHEPEGSQTFSLAQYEADAVLKRREIYLSEGLPYPLEPKGFWVYDGYKHNGEPNAATLYQTSGDTRLDEILWWVEMDLPYNYIPAESRKYLVEIFGQLGIRIGRILRLSHDNSLTWDAGEGASNAHLGNILLFPDGDQVAVAGVDFDNSLNFQNGIDTDDGAEDLFKIQKQDLTSLLSSVWDRRVVSRDNPRIYSSDYDHPDKVAEKLSERILKKIAPELTGERRSISDYLLDHFGNHKAGSLREFIGEVLSKTYGLGSQAGVTSPVLWSELLGIREYVDGQKKEFIREIEARFIEEASKEGFLLAARKHSILRGLKLPTIIDSENIILTDGSSPVDSRNEEVLTTSRRLLSLHQAHILNYPDQGKDYFSFPKVSPDILDAHSTLSQQSIVDIVRLWTEGNLKQTLANEFNPKAIGSFLLALTQINASQVEQAIKSIKLDKDDLELTKKLTLINEFFTLLPPAIVRTQDLSMYVYELADSDRSKAYDLEKEADYRTALALFGYGIITRHFEEIFNHHLLDILLNEFGAIHIPALQAALHCPELLDPVNDHAPKNALGNAQIALTGVQVRNGQLEDLAIFADQSDVTGEFKSAILRYFFASVDRNEITELVLKEALELSIDKGWVASTVRHLLISGKNLHPNSYLASSLRETEFETEDAVKILKTALDMLGGDLSRLDPTIKAVLEKPVSGLISKERAAELVLACIAFGIDLPEMMDPYLAMDENRAAFMDFLSNDKVRRENRVYETLATYPVSPIYRLMATGVQALPPRIRTLFEQYGGDQEVVNRLAASLFDSLFTDDYSYDGYFRCFFGGMLGSNGYPQTELELNDFGQIRRNGKNEWQLWRIVHPDIWKIISLADAKILTDYIKTNLPKGTVKMDLGVRNGMFGFRQTHLSECLPPHLYQKVEAFVHKK